MQEIVERTVREFVSALPVALRIAFLSIVLFSVFRNILRSRTVTMDTVFGACCVYLLMAVICAAAYDLVDRAYPGSFSFDAELGSWERREQLLYFSLITLSTVGYGDITPLTAQARMLAAVEGVLAQLFLAIIIARLVGMQLAGGRSTPTDRE